MVLSLKEKNGRVGQYIVKRRLLRFGFLRSETFHKNVRNQKQSNSECPVGVLYTCSKYSVAIDVSLYHLQTLDYWLCYTYRRGASRCSFYYDGHVERPQNVKRATVLGFTLFCVL
jgi:hypothetical protein